jgi:hypothetical protein
MKPRNSRDALVEVIPSPSKLKTTINGSSLALKQAINSNTTIGTTTKCQQDTVEGRCRLAMLPGRLGWSGHVVDATTRGCVGVMGEKVSNYLIIGNKARRLT